MRPIDKLILRLRSLVRRDRVEAELDDELRFHLDRQIAENAARGMSPQEARAAALREFGKTEPIKDECRDNRRVNLLEQLLHDVRYALRGLRNHPGFTLVALITLAIGIGANTAIFSVVNAVVFRPLPYPRPEGLVVLETRNSKQPEVDPASSVLDFFDIRESARSFESMAAVTASIWSVVVSNQNEAERAEALYVSAELFPMLGVKPAIGRVFLPEDDQRQKPSNVVMLSHSYWVRRFGGNPSIAGQSITVEGRPTVIVGVTPSGFRYLGSIAGAGLDEVDLWLPMATNPIIDRGRGVRFLNVAGRLKPGVTKEQADAEVKQIWAGLVNQYQGTNQGYEVRLQPLEEQAIGKARASLLLLLSVVGFVLLIACVNVANLLLARTMSRRKEIAVRKAMGATAGRLLRQLFTESIVLAGLGGAAGLLVAHWTLRGLLAIAPAGLPRRAEIALDWQTLMFALVAALLTGALCGVAPVIELAWRDLHATLKEGGRTSAAGSHRLRGALVVGEVSLAILLLAGAGLLIRGFLRMLAVAPGFVTENAWTVTTQMPSAYRLPAQRVALYREIEAKLREIPGVRHVGAVSRLPLLGSNLGSWLTIDGRTFPPDQRPEVEYRVATSTYFATLGIPLRSGRLYDERDDANPGSVCLINETLARRFWPDESPLGKRIRLGALPSQSGPWIEIIGVVGDVRHVGLDVAPRAEVYRPYAVNPLGSPIFVVRGPVTPEGLRGAFRAANPMLPVYDVFEMGQLVERSTAQRRFPMLLLAAFAGIALLLATVGIYGVVSHAASLRTQEIGMRVAMGATMNDVLRLVLWEGLRLAVVGAAVGLAAAAVLTRLMSTLLFGVSAVDPVAFVLAPLALILVSAIASFAPAWRAARVDPLVALRYE